MALFPGSMGKMSQPHRRSCVELSSQCRCIPKDAARLATYDLSSMKSLLHDGTNILAIQVLNEKPEPDFLIAAELEQLSKSPVDIC